MKLIENKKCTFLSMNPTFHVQIKHIDIYHHRLAQKNIKESFMKMMYCNIMEMVTNILTKGLFVDKHEHFSSKMCGVGARFLGRN
jgi:hypothetical protein